MPHPLTRDDVDLAALAAELTERLGRPIALTARTPGQRDADGAELPGVLLVLDAATGEELEDVDGRSVAAAVRAHQPPPPPEQRRADALKAARAKAGKGDTAGALADVLALLEQQG